MDIRKDYIRRGKVMRCFRDDLENLINKYSKENGSNTPDFILADYMAECLGAFDRAVERRTKWYEPEDEECDEPFGDVDES